MCTLDLSIILQFTVQDAAGITITSHDVSPVAGQFREPVKITTVPLFMSIL